MDSKSCIRVSQERGDGQREIQRAIDTVAKQGGGTVKIGPGVYTLTDALHLRSKVHVVGEDGAVLLKTPSVSSALTDYIGYGLYEFAVAEPHLFQVGMGVHIADDNSGGFYTTIGTIVRREGDAFFIDRPLKHDYHPHAGGRVATLYSLIDGTDVSDASVENLVLDGNVDESQYLTGCRGGGVFLLGCHRVRLENLEVRHYNGDAVSFQQCTDIAVRGCHLHDNKGSGLHPGSGSVRYLMEENRVHDNGNCGLFYCLRTMYSVCRGNTLERNGAAGISLGERDCHHLISGNTVRGNGKQGIDFRHSHARGADEVRVEENSIGPNNATEGNEDTAEITIWPGLHDIHIARNTINANGHAALFVAPGCSGISFVNNTVEGREQGTADIGGAQADVLLAVPQDLPPVGPDAAPADAAEHLHIDELQPWSVAASCLSAEN